MKKKDRQKEILKFIQKNGEVHSITLCRKFNVVEMTIRRDLKELEEQNKIIRTHGGAIAVEKKTFDAPTSLKSRLKINHSEKERIIEEASKFIQPNENVFLASGSTITLLSEFLINKMPLTVVTDAVNIAYSLCQDEYIHTVILGGELRSHSLTATGQITINNLKHFKLSKAFIGINGIDINGDIYTSSIVESSLLEQLFNSVESIYVLADSSKLFKTDFVKIERSQPYTLITTKNITSEERKKLESKKIRVMTL